MDRIVSLQYSKLTHLDNMHVIYSFRCGHTRMHTHMHTHMHVHARACTHTQTSQREAISRSQACGWHTPGLKTDCKLTDYD